MNAPRITTFTSKACEETPFFELIITISIMYKVNNPQAIRFLYIIPIHIIKL
jgi:hypothetical protein